VEARVIVENETIEMVMGQARRSSARPGCLAQGKSGDIDEDEDSADIRTLVTKGRRSEEPENDDGLRAIACGDWEPAAGE
jgi:hypothetical protein